MINIRSKEYLIEFGKHIKAKREELGYTQKEIALNADISISQVSRIERGLVNVSICSLQVISQAMEIPFTEMLDGYDNLEFDIIK